MKLKDLKEKRVLILGFAREGRDTFLFLRRHFPKKIIGIADQKKNILRLPKKGVKLYLGKDYLKALKYYDVILKAPGIAPHVISPFLKKKHCISSQTEIFFENCEGTIIGITGTKGKSTTTSLITAVLKAGGKRARLIGNIGEPVLKYLEKQTTQDIYVYELSSFQLEHLKESPHVAVLLNIFPEHLDHHKTFLAYQKAKGNIAKYQSSTDFLVYNKKDPLLLKIAKKSKAQKIPFSPKKQKGGAFLAPVEPALLIGKLFDIPERKIKKAIENFKPLPHRLERVGKFQGITFVNDSLATIPEATIGALNHLKNRVSTLIAGGFDRGVDMEKLAEYLEKKKLDALILFPDTGKKIVQAMENPPKHFFAKDMKEAVKLAFQHTKKGKVCLLSPAASSFNMFRDYADRGEQFKKWVKGHGKG